MDISTDMVKRIGTVAVYLMLGVIGTVAIALVLLYALQPIQQIVYDVFYLQVGPSEATKDTRPLFAGHEAFQLEFLLFIGFMCFTFLRISCIVNLICHAYTYGFRTQNPNPYTCLAPDCLLFP